MNSTKATFDDEMVEALLQDGAALLEERDGLERDYYNSVNDLIEKEKQMQVLEARIDELEDALADAGIATSELSRQVAEGTANTSTEYVLAFIAGAGFVCAIFIIAL